MGVWSLWTPLGALGLLGQDVRQVPELRQGGATDETPPVSKPTAVGFWDWGFGLGFRLVGFRFQIQFATSCHSRLTQACGLVVAGHAVAIP